MHAKKVFVGLKNKKKLAILECWSILKENNNIVFKFSIGIMKHGMLIMYHSYRKIDEHTKIASLLFIFESDKKVLACIF
jgi:hypothetical protein